MSDADEIERLRARIAELEGLLRDARKAVGRTVTHIPDASGLTLPQLEAGKQALYACSEDPSFDDVRKVIAAVTHKPGETP